MNWQNLTEKQQIRFADNFCKSTPIPVMTAITAFERWNPEIKGTAKDGFFVAHKDFKNIVNELIN